MDNHFNGWSGYNNGFWADQDLSVYEKVIVLVLSEYWYCPDKIFTARDLEKLTCISKSQVARCLITLDQKGWIRLVEKGIKKRRDVVMLKKIFQLRPQNIVENIEKTVPHRDKLSPTGTNCPPQGHSLLIENKKINKEICASTEARFDFDSLYNIYPRKEGKQQGFKKATSRIKTKSSFEKFSKAIKNYVAYCSILKIDKKFIFKFSNFMEHWTDWVDVDPKAMASDELKQKSCKIPDQKNDAAEAAKLEARELHNKIANGKHNFTEREVDILYCLPGRDQYIKKSNPLYAAQTIRFIADKILEMDEGQLKAG